MSDGAGDFGSDLAPEVPELPPALPEFDESLTFDDFDDGAGAGAGIASEEAGGDAQDEEDGPPPLPILPEVESDEADAAELLKEAPPLPSLPSTQELEVVGETDLEKKADLIHSRSDSVSSAVALLYPTKSSTDGSGVKKTVSPRGNMRKSLMSVGAAEAKMNLLRAQKEVLQVKADLHSANERIAELNATLEQRQMEVKKVKKANLDLRWREQYRKEELDGLKKELQAIKEGEHVLVGSSCRDRIMKPVSHPLR